MSLLLEASGAFQVINNDLERDDGLETSVLISLFTDRRAELEDVLPDNTDDRRGWWPDTQLNKIGSKLWLLNRSSLTPDVPARLEQYIKEALEHLVTEGVAKRIDVTVTREAMNELAMEIHIIKPTEKKGELFKYFFNWENQLLRRA